MDPLKKPVPSGLGRPVKQKGLTHACWLESARQLDQPRTLWNRVKQKTRACSEPRLRVLSDVLLQQVARPSQTTVGKSSKRWEARDAVSGTQWVGSAKKNSSACSIRPRGTCENTKPKTSFVEPQGTTTPNHFSSKPFARHTNTNQPRRMAVFQSLSICYF